MGQLNRNAWTIPSMQQSYRNLYQSLTVLVISGLQESKKGKSKKLHRCWTGPYKVVKQISQSTYRVQHVNNKSKRLVVHFDRLKVCHPDTRFSGGDTEAEATSPPEKHQESHDESGQCEFGRQLELVDDFNVEMALPLNRNLTTTAQPHVTQQDAVQHPTGRRYPSR